MLSTKSIMSNGGCSNRYPIFSIYELVTEQRRFSSNTFAYKKCYQVLGISENSDEGTIRRAYLDLVKKFHPDSSDGDLIKFQEVDKAFRTIIREKAEEKLGIDYYQTVECDIKHTAPQHRQYLSYFGVGMGTPSQREKQYTKMRAVHGAENVLKYRIAKVTADEKTLMDKKVPFKHIHKSRYGFEKLVEDLIQESMSKGEFNNLSGCGKPLKTHQNLNPYVDFVTYKINQVLIDNGFTPEWISLQKDIFEEIQKIRESLTTERKYYGSYPLKSEENQDWIEFINKHKIKIEKLNKKIEKFNLVVPILNKQMLFFNIHKEAKKILQTGEFSKSGKIKNATIVENDKNNYCNKTDNIFNLFHAFFGK